MQRAATRIPKYLKPPAWKRLRLALRPNGRAALLAAFASTSIVNYVFGIASGWLLFSGDFGLLAFAQTLLLIGGLVLSSGFATSLSASLIKEPVAHHARLATGALAANVALGSAISLALVALYSLGPLRNALESWTVTLLVAGSLPPIAILTIARAVAQGTDRFGVAAVLQVLEIGSKAAVGIGLMLAGWGATGAISGFLLGAILTALPSLYMLVRWKVLALRDGLGLSSARPVAGMFGALLGAALLLNLDIIALKVLGSNRDSIGYYQAAIVLANTPFYLGSALLPVFFAQMARSDSLEGTRSVVGEALRLVLVFLVPIEIALAVYPTFFLQWLFPATYVAGASVLPLLAAGNSAILVVTIFSAAFRATTHSRMASRIILSVVVVEVVALLLLVGRTGAQGAAAIFAVATTLTAVGLAVTYFRAVTGSIGRTSCAWFGRWLLATAAGGATIVGGAATIPLFAALAMGGATYLLLVWRLQVFRRNPRPVLSLDNQIIGQST